MNRITVSWFSAGVSSAVATWLVRDQVDRIIYTHIDDQHPDTLRFVRDCEAWFGKPVEILQSPYRTVAAAVKAGGCKFVNGPTGANCTRYLKRRVRKEWECDNQWFNTFRYVWGMDCDEAARCDRLRETMREAEHLFPLVEHGITKEEAHGILKRAGVKRPAMYDLGYRNNNCIGCVKGGKGYWNKIRVDFPDVFAARAAMEREIGGTCINGTWLDELDPTAGRDEGPVLEECGAMCEVLANIPLCVNDRREPPSAAVILGRVVEAGDVFCLGGKPGLVIETTEEQLRDFGRNLIGCKVEIRARANAEAQALDSDIHHAPTPSCPSRLRGDSLPTKSPSCPSCLRGDSLPNSSQQP